MASPSRASGETTTRFQPRIGKYTDTSQVADYEQVFYDLEDLAIELTVAGHNRWADRTRSIARRLT